MNTTTIVRRTALVGIALALACALGACAPADNPVTSPSAQGDTSTSSKTATPTPTPTRLASAIVVGMTSMTVLDASGTVLQELSYGTPGADVAYKLDRIFAVVPTESDTPGGLEAWPSHNYNWNGFELRDEQRDAAKQHPYWDYVLSVSTGSVNGVEIRTSAGTKVGDPAAKVVFDPTSPWPPYSADGLTCGVEALHSEDGNLNNAVTLYLCIDDATAMVSKFTVPIYLQL
ncbi:MAG: hypothetical protein ACOYKK_02765 [Microbacteriaceae bacterium]